MGSKGPEILNSLQTIDDLEREAISTLSPKALSYYPSATDDEITKAANHEIYQQIIIRPRLSLQASDVESDLSTTFLGYKTDIPIHVSPAAAARLAHPDGEAGIATACSRFNAIQIISHNASMTVDAIVRAASVRPEQIFGWQLYVLKDLARTEATLARIRRIPQIKFIVLTLDAPFPGKREADERFKMGEVATGGGPQVWGTEAGLTWEKTLAWLVKHTTLPIVIKGVQTFEDAYLATWHPCIKGIILSNHGGRALDTSTTPLQVLLEIRKYCPQVMGMVDVFVDGGIKRGADVVKALALGAKGVGIGRIPLYGLAVGGREGVERAMEILADETRDVLRSLGLSSVKELGMRHVNVSVLEPLLYDGPFEVVESTSKRKETQTKL